MPTKLASAHIRYEKELRDAAAAAVTRIWGDLPDYSDAGAKQFVDRVVPVIQAAQRQSVSVTDAYIARAMKRQPLGINPSAIIAKSRAGTDPHEVYHRPFVQLWKGLAEGVPFEDAAKAALARATSSAETDVQMAMRDTAHAIGEDDPDIGGWERVPNPGACDLCVAAAGQTYSTGDLQPIHNRCGCGVEPISAAQYAKSKDHGEPPGTHEHGELGPVLTKPGDHFTTESEALG